MESDYVRPILIGREKKKRRETYLGECVVNVWAVKKAMCKSIKSDWAATRYTT